MTDAQTGSHAPAEERAEHFDLDANALGLCVRALGAAIGLALVVPAPWIACWFAGWFVSRIRLDGRSSLVFQATPLSVAFLLLYPVIVVMNAFAAADDSPGGQLLAVLAAIALSWAMLRWLVGHTALAEGSLRFDGSAWTYIGWALVTCASVLTVIGWGWVLAAFYRWTAGHVHAPGGHVRFVGTGHQVLWRTVCAVLCCLPLVTMPWAVRWYVRWLVQQVALSPVPSSIDDGGVHHRPDIADHR